MEREKRSIMVVDGSATSIFYTSMMLKELRYAVRIAPTGEEALSAIAGTAPAVVITDTVLPRMSGVELLKSIKNNASLRFIPVIIQTADVNPANEEACTQAGCSAYFKKPIGPEALYRAIQSATESTPRQNIRINTVLKARIDCGVAGGERRIEDVTSLSEGGLYVSMSAPAAVNTLVPLTILLRNREIEATAVVLYSSAKAGGVHAVPGMGMKFTNISAKDVSLIRDFIRAEVMRDLEDRKAGAMLAPKSLHRESLSAL